VAGNSSVHARSGSQSDYLTMAAVSPIRGPLAEEETDKIKGITGDKNRGVDKHPLSSAARLSVSLSLPSVPTLSLGPLTSRPTLTFPPLRRFSIFPTNFADATMSPDETKPSRNCAVC